MKYRQSGATFLH